MRISRLVFPLSFLFLLASAAFPARAQTGAKVTEDVNAPPPATEHKAVPAASSAVKGSVSETPLEVSSKKKLLIIKIQAEGKLDKDEAATLDGIICSAAANMPGYKALCGDSVDDAKAFSDFSFKSGGSGCEGGWCIEAMVQQFKPQYVVRPQVKKTSSEYEIAMTLLDSKGTSTLGRVIKKLELKDLELINKLGMVLPELIKKIPEGK
jgi:hypothetical protein